MKYLLILLLFILSDNLSAQREIRFTDSLTLDTQRSWIQVEGSPFTKVGDNCSYGMEMTFYKKDNKVELVECHEGEWKLFDYTFDVSSEFGEHYIKFYKQERTFLFFNKEKEVDDFQIEVQMISDTLGGFSTELYFFSLKDKTKRILRSKEF